VTTLSIPSVEQNRPAASGRSFEIARTTVLLSDAACSLNFRIAVAHTEVSRLGKMFSTTRLPEISLSDISDRSLLTSVNPGAVVPSEGSDPEIFTGFPFSVIFAIINLSYIVYVKLIFLIYKQEKFSSVHY
jgi:hypothetical protein